MQPAGNWPAIPPTARGALDGAGAGPALCERPRRQGCRHDQPVHVARGMTIAARDADLSPSAIAAVEEALRAFARALRAVQLYLPNNPARAQSVAQARQAFARVRA